MPYVFPVAQIVLSGLSSIVYLCYGNYAKAVYWFAASVLTATVTFWIR